MHPDPKRRAALQHVRWVLAECLIHLSERHYAQVLDTMREWDARVVEGLPAELLEATERAFEAVRAHLLGGEFEHAGDTLRHVARLYRPRAVAH